MEAVLSETGDLFPYAYDAALDKRLPGVVALPRSAADVAAAVSVARSFGVPYAVRGAGTNLCGATLVPTGGMIIHVSRLNRILSVDEQRRRAWVEPGVVNLHLHKALAPRGLFYAPDPASQKACTLGGNVGTNAGGPHCLKYGVTSHHVTGLELVRPTGETVRVSSDDPGFDLTGLFVGSEGTLGIATKIELNLLPQPEEVRTFLVAFDSMEAAAATVSAIIADGIVPATLEVMDRLTVQAVESFVHAGYPASAEAVLLIEVDGRRDQTAEEGERVRRWCLQNGGTDFRAARNEAEREKLWEGRRGAYAAMARLAPNVMVEDGVVPRTRLPEAVKAIRAIADREKIRMGLIAHAGDGNLHPNMIYDERDRAETQRVVAAGQEMLRVCVDLGGSISGEHGVGADKREAMRWLFTPPTLSLFRGIKNSLDPENLCNPDKMIPVADTETVVGPAGPPADGDHRPTTVDEVVELVRGWAQARAGFAIVGKETAGPAVAGGRVLRTGGLNKIVEVDKGNMTLTVEAGADINDVRARLESECLFLHVAGTGTMGGLLSRDAGGPELGRDLLGLKAVSGKGELMSFGAKVMKNVAGYDVVRLFKGAWGRLGVVVEMTLRIHARKMDPPLATSTRTGPPVLTELHHQIRAVFDPCGFFNYGNDSGPHPLLRSTFESAALPPQVTGALRRSPQEGKENIDFPSPLGRG
jgi:glycolate oxidase